MTKRTIVIYHPLNEEVLNYIKQIAPNWEVFASEDFEVLKEPLKRAEIIVRWKKNLEEYVQHNANLRWVQTWSAGINSLPLDEWKTRDILITSANGVHAYPISETIFAHLLGFTRKLHSYVRQQSEKTWHNANLKQEIHEKTIGIIGVGAIGKETAKIAKAFGMNVLGMRHSGQSTDFVDQMYTPDQLHEVLPLCDFVVITLPLTKETKHLFGAKQFSRMKDSAFLVNIGRGDIIVEEELIQALQNKEIAGAGLDVFATEPLPEDSPLWEMENVIVTPHTAGATEYYTERVIQDIFLPNLQKYIQGEKPTINLVDYEKGY